MSLLRLTESEKLFFKNELKEITRGSWKKRLTLPLFVFLAALGVAFSTSGLDFLELKMSDPFVKWIEFPITTKLQKPDAYVGAMDTLEVWRAQRANFLSEVSGYFRYTLTCYGNDGTAPYITGRTIDVFKDTALIKHILSPSMVVMDNRAALLEESGVDEEYMWRNGIILTEEVYKRLFADAQTRTLVVKYGRSLFPVLNIVAVVKSLPNRSSFLTTHTFYWTLTESNDRTHLQKDVLVDTMRLFLAGAPDENADIPALIKTVLFEKGMADMVNNARVYGSSAINTHPTSVTLELAQAYGLDDRKRIFRFLNETELYRRNAILEGELTYRDYESLTQARDSRYVIGGSENMFHRISLGFSELDSIRPFSRAVLRTLDVELDLHSVESKENYNLVTLLTRVLAGLLLVFALTSVVIFIFNLVTSHLEHIRSNLGTFRAFGLTKRFILYSYLRITLFLLSLSVLSSLFVLIVLNLTGAFGMVLRLLRYDNEIVDMPIRLSGPWLIALVILLFMSTYLVTRLSVIRIIRSAPGDLIYGRK